MWRIGAVTCRETLSSLKMVKKKVFVDERWSQNRNVTAIDWSAHVCMCVIAIGLGVLGIILHLCGYV